MNQKNKFLLLHFVYIIISLAIILYLYPATHHTGGLFFPASKTEIEDRASGLLDALNYDVTDYTSSLNIRHNRNVYTFLLRKYGISGGNTLLRESVPAFYWDIRWRNPDVRMDFGSVEDNEVITGDDFIRSAARMQFDGHGNLIRYQPDISDTLYIPGVEPDSARVIAEKFLHRFTKYDPAVLTFSSHKEEIRDNRTDHIFRWKGQSEYHPLPYTLSVNVAGSIISSFAIEFDTDPELSGATSTQRTVSSLVSILPFILIAVIMLVIGVKRIRSEEIGYKNGIILGVIVSVMVAAHIYLQEFIHQMEWMMLIPLIIGPLFVGFFIVFVVVVAEAVGRNTWKEKFIAFDLVIHGHILHSETGKSFIRGVAYGLIALTLSMIIIQIVNSIHPVWYSWVDGSPLENFSPPLAGLKILMYEFWVELIGFSMLVLFLVSYLRQRISNVIVLLIVASVIYGVGEWRYTYPSFPVASGILIASLYGAFLVWVFYRYDVVTSFLSLFTFSVAGGAITLILSGNDYFISEGIIIASVFGALLVFGAVSQYTRDHITDYEEIAPVFQKYISERERLQRELEIAHDVQMSFLPKKKPDIPALDVASTCIPAHEVGGDYYDFITINDHLFGIVIGDVSGKGTKASFYMTLTKGILRSTARNETDPAEVLRSVNRTFYESAERGAFISMVYGIFDLKQRTLTVARAGHNPVILWKTAQANVEMINPKGMALGLDNGEVFDKSIHEKTVTFEPGDVFIFYTDGFSEAANKRNEEFGDERLVAAARFYQQYSAGEILNGLVNETNMFIGRTPQRDDMTMVVVKVKNTEKYDA